VKNRNKPAERKVDTITQASFVEPEEENALIIYKKRNKESENAQDTIDIGDLAILAMGFLPYDRS